MGVEDSSRVGAVQYVTMLALLLLSCTVIGCSPDSPDSINSSSPINESPTTGVQQVVVDDITRLGAPPLMEQFLSQDDPDLDGWESEVQSRRLMDQLRALARLLSTFKPTSESPRLKSIIDENFETASLRPVRRETVFRGPRLHVEEFLHAEQVTESHEVGTAERESRSADARGNDPLQGPGKNQLGQDAFKGPGGFARAWKALLEKFLEPTGLEIEFTIFDIQQTEDRIRSRQHVTVHGADRSQGFQVNATWTIHWTVPTPENPPRIRSIQVDEYRQVTLDGAQVALFQECTESVLGGNGSFHEQLLPGANYWASRIENRLGSSIRGHQGLAIADVNGDGLDDLYLCQPGGSPNRLLIQNSDGSASDMSQRSGVDFQDLSYVPLFVDFDNDGDQDLLLSGATTSLVMANDGSGKFSHRTELPIAGCFSAAAADFDLDGDPDVYLARYSSRPVEPNPSAPDLLHDANDGGRNALFRNDGDFQFSDVTREVGLEVNNQRYSTAAVWEDFDNDADQDLYVVNDFGLNCLYRNEEGHFTEIADQVGASDRSFGASACWGDFNRDGGMDLFLSNLYSAAGNRILAQPRSRQEVSNDLHSMLRQLARGSTLLKNTSMENATPGAFEDLYDSAGVSLARRGWGASFVDVNSDGWEDLVVANGGITSAQDRPDLASFFWRQVALRAPEDLSDSEVQLFQSRWFETHLLLRFGRSWNGGQSNCCFLNTRDGRFATVSAVAGLHHQDDSRAIAAVDWDHDGDTDLWIANRSGPRIRFLRNSTFTEQNAAALQTTESAERNHFLSLLLVGNSPTTNRCAIGARIELMTSGADSLRQVRTVRAGNGFLSQSSRWVTFGLPSDRKIERVVVDWPGGQRESFTGANRDGWYQLHEGAGTAQRWQPPQRDIRLSATTTSIVPEAPLSSRSPLAVPFPMLDLPYADFMGKSKTVLDSDSRGPLLINLWSHWCGPALKQLGTWGEESKQLKSLNLRIVALHVDSSRGGGNVNPQSMVGALAEMNFPFESGVANEETLAQIRFLQLELFQWHEALVVPMSLLVDSRGNLAAIYRGPVSVAQLMDDVSHLQAAPEQRRNRATPLEGRWHAAVPELDLVAVGERLRTAGYLSAAKDVYERVLRQNSDQPSVHAVLGFLKHQQGNVDEAIVHYRRALRDTDDVESRFNLAQALQSSGRLDESAVSFRDALRIDPGHVRSRIHYGQLLIKQERPDEALEQFRKILAQNEDYVEAYLEIGKIYHRREWYQKALIQYEQALQRAPGDPAILTAIGVTLINQGRRREAISKLRQALDADPDFAPALEQLQRVQATP